METLQTATQIQTRCPNCQTVFEIGEDIVNSDDPRVRCGECYAIFHARENMLVSSLSDDLLLEAEPDDDVLLSLDSVAEFNLEDDRVFFEPDDSEQESGVFSDSDLFSADAGLPEVEYLDDEEIPELDFESIDPEDDQFDGTLFDDVSIDNEVSEPVITRSEWSADGESANTDINTQAGFSADAADTAVLDDFPETPDFMRPLHDNEGSGRWKARALMAAALLVGLGGLYAYSNRNVSSDSTVAQMVNNAVCKFTDCGGEAKSSLGELRVIRRNVYTHPKVVKALVINIVFRNDASFAQPYPTLAIQMSDIRGKVVAQRDFLPHEYLKTTAVDEIPVIDAEQIVDVSLEVNDPGDSAKSFELQFK